MRYPLAISYGMGVDSTAVLVGLRQRGIRPDLIMFADTGSERPETYAYWPIINAYLARIGFPPVTLVRKSAAVAPYRTLYDACVVNQTPPSIAVFHRSCSVKWKHAPMDAHCAQVFGKQTVIRAIGYDAGPIDSARGLDLKPEPGSFFHYVYPLREWGWDRERCKQEIAAAGLPVPIKSSCFFCASMKPSEVHDLAVKHPHLADMIIHLETVFLPYAREIEGLWNKRRAYDGRPGSMTEYIQAIRAGKDVSRIVDVVQERQRDPRAAKAKVLGPITASGARAIREAALREALMSGYDVCDVCTSEEE